MIELPLFGREEGAAFGINERGEIVGFVSVADGPREPVVWRVRRAVVSSGPDGSSTGSEAPGTGPSQAEQGTEATSPSRRIVEATGGVGSVLRLR